MSHLFPTYARWDVEPEQAEGCVIIDKNGKKYLDFTSGIGVCNLGHRPKAVQKAISSQLNKFWHVSNLFVQGEQEKAAQLLAEAAKMDLVFFANSGAEANEAAIKLARKATGRKKIITFTNSFHGRTFATMSATGQDKIKTGFGPMLETFVYLPFNDLDALKQVVDNDTAAIMLEVVQGEGGIHIGKHEFLQGVQELCKEYNALFIIDEIQTGIGRTGTPFSFQQFNLTPDIVTSAKGLGNGLPIGAVIGRKELETVFGPGSHGSTFGGNPLSVAAAIATMETIFQEEFLQNVLNNSQYLFKKICSDLSSLEEINEVRNLGFMFGIETSIDLPVLLKELRENGLLALPAGNNILRLLPPLTVSISEMEEAVNIIKTVMKKLSKTAV
ncbi:acetylornithine transaminase [Bacillus sp. DTU_2020_1000418_1_SI_GHA_SEK_038]|uniref:acetylornithine transaminase n=1 Tax=Bacillus sp. DTU_2020_1000418_1_SI_GHA_SEK_038 TaxID=3077585 RepID=UPI0028F035BD|nr:acetylornithine transaminase [Bacillus sp. DTU_2020_1000418_1_SI_GHA_SEK_038]WNS76848.1 acetylornithine transaminase [Bacillus sp. DTU_2020_1000418_1_SI_GHA_SEK_038]